MTAFNKATTEIKMTTLELHIGKQEVRRAKSFLTNHKPQATAANVASKNFLTCNKSKPLAKGEVLSLVTVPSWLHATWTEAITRYGWAVGGGRAFSSPETFRL
jgi:hypothetical protein